MQIREMTEGDLEAVAELEQQIFSNPWSGQSIQKAYEQEQNIYLIAEEEGEVAGYCGIWCSFDTADLCRIAVVPKWRRKGVASLLLDEAVKRCSLYQVQSLLLEVRASNMPAIYLYEKMNFQKIHVRKKYYRNPVADAWIMQLPICRKAK